MLKIVTVNAGDYQGRGVEYTNVLFDCVRRNLAEGYRGQFIVFTDQPEGYDDGITVAPLPAGISGWFNKLYLFKPGLFDDGDRVLYLDLSAVPCGRLDEIAAYEGNFAILRDFYRPDGLQSSVMAWRAPYMSWPSGGIWAEWLMSQRPEPDGGDQEWIEECFRRHGVPPDILQEQFPELFISYKAHGRNAPLKASVCVFHGIPKPHEAGGWIDGVWKIDGMARAELDVVCNTNREAYMANVRLNSERDLPWLQFKPAHDSHVAIVGGAPSLEMAAGELRYRASLGHDIWALNGSYSWLKERGIQPSAHFIIDARPDNVAFVHADPLVKYYIASQCDPAVFDALEQCDVTVFHLLTDGMAPFLQEFQTDKPTHLIGGGTTVAIKAMLIAHEIGYRKIHCYGMDSSYTNSQHHVYEQRLNDADRVVNAVCANRMFRCAPWMVTQATDFIAIAHHLVRDGTIITVNGDGLIPFAAREMANTPTYILADVRAAEVLARCNGATKGAEIGSFCGDMSAALLSKDDLTLYMVDSWRGDGADYLADTDDYHAELSQAQQDLNYERAKEQVRFAGDRARIIRKESRAAANDFPDGSLDFVFIDADHSYEGSQADINAWFPKVKAGGLLCGHDFGNTHFKKFGVTRSVMEFSRQKNLAVDLGENFTWFIRLKEAT